MSSEHKDRFVAQIYEMMTQCSVPYYLKQARILLISKKSGAACKITDSRTIQLLNFAFKVMEHCFLAKILASGIFDTVDYKAGFKRFHKGKTRNKPKSSTAWTGIRGDSSKTRHTGPPRHHHSLDKVIRKKIYSIETKLATVRAMAPDEKDF